MTREEKIAVIYKEMASKERSIGCKVYVKYRAYYHGETGGEEWHSKSDNLIVGVDGVARNGNIDIDQSDLSKADSNGYIEDLETLVQIIGHPVMIGDVLDWLDKKICLLIDQGKDIEKLLKGSDALNLRLINIWKYKTKPLDEQPDHCIDYVTDLLDKFGSVI